MREAQLEKPNARGIVLGNWKSFVAVRLEQTKRPGHRLRLDLCAPWHTHTIPVKMKPKFLYN